MINSSAFSQAVTVAGESEAAAGQRTLRPSRVAAWQALAELPRSAPSPAESAEIAVARPSNASVAEQIQNAITQANARRALIDQAIAFARPAADSSKAASPGTSSDAGAKIAPAPGITEPAAWIEWHEEHAREIEKLIAPPNKEAAAVAPIDVAEAIASHEKKRRDLARLFPSAGRTAVEVPQEVSQPIPLGPVLSK